MLKVSENLNDQPTGTDNGILSTESTVSTTDKFDPSGEPKDRIDSLHYENSCNEGFRAWLMILGVSKLSTRYGCVSDMNLQFFLMLTCS
jgi:hypothetical protein